MDLRVSNTEWSQKEKQILCINTYMWHLVKWYWWTYVQGRNRDAGKTCMDRGGGVGGRAELGDRGWHTGKTASWWESGVWHGELSAVCCDDLDGWGEVQEGGDVCGCRADSRHYTEEMQHCKITIAINNSTVIITAIIFLKDTRLKVFSPKRIHVSKNTCAWASIRDVNNSTCSRLEGAHRNTKQKYGLDVLTQRSFWKSSDVLKDINTVISLIRTMTTPELPQDNHIEMKTVLSSCSTIGIMDWWNELCIPAATPPPPSQPHNQLQHHRHHHHQPTATSNTHMHARARAHTHTHTPLLYP